MLDDDDYNVPMQRIPQPRFDNTLEAEIQEGDTLQAIALRFHCTVAEIKRLNKIDKDNEIYARKTIKVPITPHSVLLETLPIIHKSGQSSPKRNQTENNVPNPLETSSFNEKLLVASVNSADKLQEESINNIILNSRLKNNIYADVGGAGDQETLGESLLSGELDETMPQPRPIPGPSKNTFDCSGSDCDMSWICLFICILALCFAVPLVYVFYIAEHPEKYHHSSN